MSAGSRPWPGGVAGNEAAAAVSGGPPRALRLDTARTIANATAPAARRRGNETERRPNMFQLLPILAANHTVKKPTSDLRSRREESPERKRGRSLAPREAQREE